MVRSAAACDAFGSLVPPKNGTNTRLARAAEFGQNRHALFNGMAQRARLVIGIRASMDLTTMLGAGAAVIFARHQFRKSEAGSSSHGAVIPPKNGRPGFISRCGGLYNPPLGITNKLKIFQRHLPSFINALPDTHATP